MMTEIDDPMVLEHRLATRAREIKESVSKTGDFENSIGDAPTFAAVEATELAVGMETTPRALTHRPVGDDMRKPGDEAQSEAAQEEDLALPLEPNEEVRVTELSFESPTFSSPLSGNLNATAGEGTAVAQKKRRIRRKNWGQGDTNDLLGAVSNTKKRCTRIQQGCASGSYWYVVAERVPGRAWHECRGRMDSLNRSCRKTKEYCDEHGKEFKHLTEKDFGEMKVSPRLTEAWYNQIRDLKKVKMNRAGSSSQSTGLVPNTSSSDLEAPVLPDGIDQGEPALVDPPACQLERQVAGPLRHHQAPPASPHSTDRIEDFEDFLAIPIERALSSAPSLPRYDRLDDLDEAWNFS